MLESCNWVCPFLQAQEKMHHPLPRTFCHTKKITVHEDGSILRKPVQEDNITAISKDGEVSLFASRNSDHGHNLLTFFALEPNGCWRIVSLPLQYANRRRHLGSEAWVKMDSCCLASSIKFDQPKPLRDHASGKNLSAKLPRARSFSGPIFQHQPHEKGARNKARWNSTTDNSSCQTSFNSSDSSIVIPGSSYIPSSDLCTDFSKLGTDIKRNHRKKARKKGKQYKKLLCNTELAEMENDQGSASQTGANCTDYGVGPLPHATESAISLPQHAYNETGSIEIENGSIHRSEIQLTCASFIDELDASEANFTAECSLSSSESRVQSFYPEMPIVNDDKVQDPQSKPQVFFTDQSSSFFSETNDSSALDSTLIGSNCDENTNASFEANCSNKESAGANLSESIDYINRKELLSQQIGLNGFPKSCSHAEGAESCKHGWLADDVARNGKTTKRLQRNLTVSRLSSTGNFYRHFGRDNNHSVWQKVQRNDTAEFNCGLRKENEVSSECDAGLVGSPLPKKDSKFLPSKHKASRKLRRKTSSGPKEDLVCYTRDGFDTTKACSNASVTTDAQQSGIMDMPSQLSELKGLNSFPRSHSKVGCISFELETEKVVSVASEPVHSFQANTEEPANATLTCLCDKPTRNENTWQSSLGDYCGKPKLLEGQSMVTLHPRGLPEVTKIDKDVPYMEHNTHDYSLGSSLQTWMPVGTKDSMLKRSDNSNSVLLGDFDKHARGNWNVESMEDGTPSDSHALSSSTNARSMCMVKNSGDENGSDYKEGLTLMVENQCTCSPKESCINHDSAKCHNGENENQGISSLQNDLDMIAEAVNAAYRAQLASEAVEMASDGPIAEIERLLYSASPVICNETVKCQTCSPDRVLREFLCRHETSDISLGSLWQWYEKHGSYGLEVRGEDYGNSKRLGIDRFAFSAYFVPYLSAIQLFIDHKSSSKSSKLLNSNRITGSEALEACKHNGLENSSGVGLLPIFSVLVPRPCMKNTSSSQLPVSFEDKSSVHLDNNAEVDDLEILFEYFATEQPQQRRPLFHMIKELVRGDVHSQCKTYGDPTKLDSVALHDLHPKSWYSVAWYPIYRIPDGNFRAAFLTYHSLGHFVRRKATSDSFIMDAVVCPVVGLQSYNAQAECWLKLRKSAHSHSAEVLNLNPSGVLKERLRTLEQTACLMARAAVTKGNLISLNRQPDYEFFLSRRR